MSSLLERIARRRRASAGRRLGPPPRSANGHVANGTRNGNGSLPDPAGPDEPRPIPKVDSIALEALAAGPVFVPALSLPALEWPPSPAPAAERDEPELASPEVEPDAHEARVDPAPAGSSRAEPAAPVEPAPVGSPRAEPAAPDPVLPAYESWLPPRDLLSPDVLPATVASEPLPLADEEVVGTALVPADRPGFLQRGRMRRRARYLRQLRELQLRDLGGFLLEAYRYGRERPDLVRGKLRNAAQIDGELRTLERTLLGTVPLRELRVPGIGGACSQCGTVHGSGDRFCAHCGHALTRAASGSEAPEADSPGPEPLSGPPAPADPAR